MRKAKIRPHPAACFLVAQSAKNGGDDSEDDDQDDDGRKAWPSFTPQNKLGNSLLTRGKELPYSRGHDERGTYQGMQDGWRTGRNGPPAGHQAAIRQ
jgi:hypothetical protein